MLPQITTVEYSKDCEADDVISHYQYLGFKTKQRIIVATEDKDAKQTAGLLYNPRTSEINDCSGFGAIWLKQKTNNVKKLDGYGRLWLYYQIVCGDPIDTYNPFPLRGQNVTDYAFYLKFKDFTKDEEAWNEIAKIYKTHYGTIESWVDWQGNTIKGTWVDLLQAYADVAFMQRWENDRILVKDVLKKYEIV